METATPIPESEAPGSLNAGSSSTEWEHDHTPQPNKLSAIAEVARRQILKAGAFGSPVRRSPRLSCLPPPQPLEDTLDALDESSADESDSVNDIALQLSREETPENDFLPDEPSTVLASRIMRAHDNPSPPPQNLAHPGTNYVPGRDGQFPLFDVSVPPSPFRAINLLERLNQLSGPPFDPSSRPCTPDSVEQPAKESGYVVQHDRIPPTLFAIPVPNQGAHAIDTSSTPSLLKHILSPPLESANQNGAGKDDPPSERASGTQQASTTGSFQALGGPSALAVDHSSESNAPSTPTNCPEPSPPVQGLLHHPAGNDSEGSSSTSEVLNPPDGKDDNGAEALPMAEDSLSTSNENQTSPMEAASHVERLRSLSPDSTKMLTGIFSPSQPAASIEHVLADSMRTTYPPATPTRIPVSSAAHPDFSQTTVQRPVIAPTPVRASFTLRKLTSPLKFSSDPDDATRTPAQRVPIQAALSRGIPSVQRTIHLTSGLDPPNTGRFPNTRAPVFTRPALDDPSRSPAKRVPVTGSVVPPTGGREVQSSPTRLALRARSASVEPHSQGTVPVRSQSLEPSAALSKHDDLGKPTEPNFQVLPTPSRSGAKLPFPLVSGHKPSSDLPPPIPEESGPVATRKIESSAPLGKVPESTMKSQLKQPSTSSRIPRIGSKPYARPPSKLASKNGKPTVAVTANTASTTAPAFRFTSKNEETRNNASDGVSTQPLDSQCPTGSLKRKRGGEATSGSHPVMIRQVVPGMLSGKYARKPSQSVPSTRPRPEPTEPSPLKPAQPMKFRKVVDGMLSARYAPSKPNSTQTPPADSVPTPPSPLSDISSSSNEEPSKDKLPPLQPLQVHDNNRSNSSPIPEGTATADADVRGLSPPLQDTSSEEAFERPRRTSRSRKPAQQQYVLDVFGTNTTTRPPAARRKPQTRTDADGFMGMSATALKALTTSNTTKNQQTVVVLATEVIRKDGLRPESPTVKMKTILQKKRDERDVRRQERAEKRARMIEGLGASDTEESTELGEQGARTDHDENDSGIPRRHRRGPGEEEDYETPERSERNVEPLRFEGVSHIEIKRTKQVKWDRGLSTAIYLDELPPRGKSLSQGVIVVKGCLAPTSKNLPLDPLGNLLDIENRPLPELVTEHVVVKKYLYDNDIEPEPIPQKVTRSKSKKNKS